MPDSRSTSNAKAEQKRPAATQPTSPQDGEATAPAANERRKEKFDELLHEGDGEARKSELPEERSGEAARNS